MSQDKSNDKKTDAASKEPGATASPPNVTSSHVRTYTRYGGPLLPEPSFGPSHPNDLDFPFYQPLLNARTRTALHLSGEQEKKLHELSRKYVAEFRPKEREVLRGLHKAMANSPPDEQNRKMYEAWIKIRQEARPVRKQVEELLTSEQLTKLRMLVLIGEAVSLCDLYFYPTSLTEEKKLTEEQKKEFKRLARFRDQLSMETSEKILQADRENDEKAVGVLTSSQREQLERQIREGESGKPIIFGQQLAFNMTFPPGVGHVGYPPLWEFQNELGLSTEQRSKLQAISVNSQPSQSLYALYKPAIQTKTGAWASSGGGKPPLSPQLEQILKRPEVRQKVEELKKQFRQQIDAVLTPQQLTTLKKMALRKAVARRARDPEIPADLHPTERQKAEMYRLFAARAEARDRFYQESREKFVDAVSPQLRQRCFEELDRQAWGNWLLVNPASRR
jgi:hypothetical protein